MVNKRRFIKQLRVDWEDSTGEKLSVKDAEKMIGPEEWSEMESQAQYIKTPRGRRKVIW